MTIIKVLNVLKEDRTTRKLHTRARCSKTEDELKTIQSQRALRTVNYRLQLM
jgi:hypothetical protein